MTHKQTFADMHTYLKDESDCAIVGKIFFSSKWCYVS